MNYSDSLVVGIFRKFYPGRDEQFYRALMILLSPAIMEDARVLSMEAAQRSAFPSKELTNIRDAVVRVTGVLDLGCRSRKKEIIFARFLFFSLAISGTKHSTGEIGKWLNPERPFDHSSVIHARKTIANDIVLYPEKKCVYDAILQILKR